LDYVASVGEDDAAGIVAERERSGPYRDVRDLAQRAPVDEGALEALVASGACDSFGSPRRTLLWELGLVPRAASVPGTGGAERQRPATGKGVVSMLVEDEFGQVNLIVPPPVYERFRAIVRGEPLLLARGRYERVERNRNVLVSGLETLGPLARRVADEADVHG